MTCDVNTPSYPSVQSAVDDVNCTQVHIPAGGYVESVVISRSVEIYGDDKTTTGVFGNNGSVFHINPSGFTVNIHDLTISGGQALSGGGIYDDGNALIVNNCIIDSNRVVVARLALSFSGGAGGGIYLTGQAVATISNTTISNNNATVGGGIAINGVSRPPIAGAFLENCTLSQNSATVTGGGIFSILGGLLIDNTTIEDNHVNCVVLATGGGLSTLLGGTVINNSHFLRNNATSSTVDAAGGAINNAGDFLDNTVGIMNITDTDFVSNSTTAYFLGSGGAISNTTAGTVTCTRCTIRNNSSGNGGGIDSDRHGVVNLVDSTVSGNTVSGIIAAFGGGIRVLDGALTISGSTIDHNHATGLGRGGALYVAGDAGVEPGSSFATPFPTSVSITNSTIANNNADALGGALGGRGGGIYAETTGSLSSLQINLRNVTMAFDSADLLGNEIYHDADAVVAQSKIIAENTIMKSYVGTSPIDCTTIVLGNGGTTSNGGNVGDCFSTGGTDINGDPLLSTLTSAGGATQTIPLTAGSPAINHGTANCPPADQRGVFRDGPCDSGAFEYIDEFLNARTPAGPADPGATITATFSQNTTAAPNAFAIISELQGTINANLTGAGTTTLTLTPPSPFIVGDNIHVIATNGIQRNDGKPLQNPQQWSFSVNNTTPFCSGGFKQVNTNVPVGYQSVMTWADYDGDGKLDILACGTFSPCDVFHNNAGTFTAIHANLPWLAPVVAAWGDYDGDGKPDFILSGIDFHTGLPVTKLYHNDGGGSFTEVTTTLPQVANGAVAWTDYNNDGKLDLLLGGTDKNNKNIVDVYKNTGGGNFEAINSGLPQLMQMKVAWGDFNSDGYPDIIVQGFSGLTRITQAYQNVGNDAFVAVGAGVALADGSVTWIDFDGDGKLDALVTGLDGSGTAQTVLLHNTGTVFQVQSPPLPPLYRSSVLALDFDGDGLPDLVMTGDSGNTEFSGVFRNLGGGNFTQINAGLPRLGQSFIQAGDYDRDGHVDLLVYGWNGSTFIAAVEQQVPCSAGDDAFVATQDTPLVVPAPGILANDFEVNPTIVVDTNPASGTLTMNGGGAFTYAPAAGFSGNVAFTYHLTDGAFWTNVATASIHVNPTGTCRATFDNGATVYASSD
ncbi:MAG: FG-GAP-like repeat-containing protein, partial [Thermoanaerobaculia bacterium]